VSWDLARPILSVLSFSLDRLLAAPRQHDGLVGANAAYQSVLGRIDWPLFTFPDLTPRFSRMESSHDNPPTPHRLSHAAERRLEEILFASRWLMAPFYLGLVVALWALLFVFLRELVHEISLLPEMNAEGAILMALSLIDMSLAGNLMLIVIFSGYENFVSRFDVGDLADRPAWMGKVDFSALKLKLVSSIVAISAIALLRAFMKIGSEPLNETELGWLILVHLTFVTSGVLLALMDFLASRSTRH
jgi:uncharacterized protein (TIGR00645 family)